MSDLDAVADWLVVMGYPVDWSSEHQPPPVFRTAIEEAWVRKDGPWDADIIRRFVAEEGGWLCVEGVRPDQCDHSSTGGRCDVCNADTLDHDTPKRRTP